MRPLLIRGTFRRIRRVAIIGGALALCIPAAASGTGGIVFAPAYLPTATVGLRYLVVIRVTRNGHNPALGKDYPSYTVACYGADQEGGFLDDCKKLPPGLRTAEASATTCPPLKAACIELRGIPRKPGRYTFRISAPDVTSIGVRGVVRRYTVVVRRG
jgi:hypothetical protein